MQALKIFSIDKKYQEVPFSKKVEYFREFFASVNTLFMRCSENCKLCDCVVIELKESYNHILELKLIDHFIYQKTIFL